MNMLPYHKIDAFNSFIFFRRVLGMKGFSLPMSKSERGLQNVLPSF